MKDSTKKELASWVMVLSVSLVAWASVALIGSWWSIFAAFALAVAVGFIEAAAESCAKNKKEEDK